MFDDFKQYFREYVPELTDEQLQLICSKSATKKVRKRQLLLHEGEVSRHKILVLSGLFRVYNIAADGSEHIMRFSAEYGWIVDPASYYNNTPSDYTIEAIEAGEVMLWHYDDFEVLRATIPLLSTFSEKLMTRNMGDTQKRILMNLSATAEEKYQYFVATYPDIFRRVPLHMVASYLGVSRETLTRVRHGQSLIEKA